MKLNAMDGFLDVNGAAALVLRDSLAPVEGADSPFFPPTFASGDTFAGGYNIDGEGAASVCLVDSVGSQANRIEPIFKTEPYSQLVPQIVIQAGDTAVTVFDAGHRAGDAIIRCSSLQEEIHSAFRALAKGDAVPLAKIAPTSLVFGVWDSRDTQAKAPRLFSSTIRAFDVQRLTRSAQYIPAAEYVSAGLIDEPTDPSGKKALSEKGFLHVPASASHGGVIARGGIRRDATLSLAALQLLHAGTDAEQTVKLRRYILGLGLVAFTWNPSGYLRQGCNLVLDGDAPEPRKVHVVHRDGKREAFTVDHAQALAYATEAAKAFGVGESRTVPFDKERAKRDLTADAEKKLAKAAAKKAKS